MQKYSKSARTQALRERIIMCTFGIRNSLLPGWILNQRPRKNKNKFSLCFTLGTDTNRVTIIKYNILRKILTFKHLYLSGNWESDLLLLFYMDIYPPENQNGSLQGF